MNVSGTGSMMQTQMQMRKMDGTGGGNGGANGMRDIMQSLSPDERNTLKEQLSSVSEEDRKSLIEQMKEVDKTNMSSDDYFQTLLDIVNQTNTENSSNNILSIYA
ncbi:hypothetical protein RZR97_06555 [Hydrogenimonas thermophila]|uniref:hypothetical protein n=1 Tax=Hydrogenimonas thermophila TaxID=223786 RepID=UPI00293703BB|nr:hypothetical protein [Hydrogenimonas thermophila]WOE68777.1 hypothetical protein RZR91_06575 [Hydrogenimonas thermophila]WOE71287.1 hypothetical protein RZR97_06555 [Hydrogenimonas thermophila]